METKKIKIRQHKLLKFILSTDSDMFDEVVLVLPNKVRPILSALNEIINTTKDFSPKLERCINLFPNDVIELSVPSEIEEELFNGGNFKRPKLVKTIEDYFNGDENRTYIRFILDDDESEEEVATYYLHREDDVEEKLHWLLLKAHETGRNSKYLYYCVFDDIGEDILFESMSVHEILWSLIFE